MILTLSSIFTPRLSILAGLLLVTYGQCQAPLRLPSVELTEKDTVGYGFLDQDKNEIENAQHLHFFFQKLLRQRVEGGQKISIVHIGDSHILGNLLTREVRTRLQNAFGDAGRGIIFPYRIAGTNGPTDYLMETNCRWTGGNCQRDRSPETRFGLSGFCLESSAADGYLGLRLRDTATSDERKFTKITVFHRNDEKSFDFDVADEASGQTAQLVIEGKNMASWYFDRPTDQAQIRLARSNAAQKSCRIDAICLENEMAGVLYHSVGVNGARFADFTRARHFAEQVGELFPDLVILSFGTNEAQDPSLTPRALYNQIDQLVKAIQEQAPGTPILLTTPADSYLRGKSFNPRMGDVSIAIRKYAEDKGLAIWDLYKIGGGENSAERWKRNGLMSSDSVHYSKLGYAVQGKLFYQSLIKGYNEFSASRP